MSKGMKTRKGKDGIYYPYTSPDIVVDSAGESQTTKNNNMKTDIDSIKTDLGTAQLTTTAKNIKGSINEVAAQYKDIAKQTIVEGNKLYLVKTDGTKLDSGTDLPQADLSNYAKKEDIGSPTQEQVNTWLNAHPEATTTVQNKSITPIKLSFVEAGKNKYNIDAVEFGIFTDPRSGKLVRTNNSNYYTIELEVLPQTQYLYAGLNTVKDSYVKTNGGIFSFLDKTRNVINYVTNYDTEYIETPENCYYIVHSVYSNLTYEQLLDRKPMFVLKSDFDTISNMFGNYIPFEYILNQNVVKVENNIKIIDNLNSTDSNNPLSANMGNELNKKINSISIASDNPWKGKIGITYGDSITAINNPESPTDLWGTMGKYNSWGYYVKTHLGLDKLYGRGIGGQTYSWRTNGGSVAFINSDGSVNKRDDNFNFDNYSGEIPSNTTKVRGAFCSWSRITAMIPESIKNTIDFIFVMGGSNDIPGDGAELGDHTFIKDDKTDPEWGSSSYYNGGDFNISTYIGGMSSTIMKLQLWCPNAVIIVGTPPNGRASINPNINENEWCKNSKNLYYIDYITEQEKILKDFGIPCIDIYGKAGINPFNRKLYIADWVHPYSDNGCKALARVIIGDMKNIIPNF